MKLSYHSPGGMTSKHLDFQANGNTYVAEKQRSQVKTKGLGIPWQSNGGASELSLPWAWVQSLVRELGSHKPLGMAEKDKNPKGSGPLHHTSMA